MGKEKKTINILTVFFISYKSDVKTFLKWIVNKCPLGTRQHDPLIISTPKDVNIGSHDFIFL